MTNKKINIQYNKFICEFYRELNKIEEKYSNLVFICIGTDKIVGDCFGPIVGYRLNKNLKNNCVYGTLGKTVNAVNVNEIIIDIYEKYKNPCLVAIDAALSKEEYIGKIIVSNKFLYPGRALEKKNERIGNISIKAIIGEKQNNIIKNMETLQNTSLNMVTNLAKIVSDGIIEVLNCYSSVGHLY